MRAGTEQSNHSRVETDAQVSISLRRCGREKDFSNEPREVATDGNNPSTISSQNLLNHSVGPQLYVERKIPPLRRAGDEPTSPSGDSHARATRIFQRFLRLFCSLSSSSLCKAGVIPLGLVLFGDGTWEHT